MRACTIFDSTRLGVLVGDDTGLEDRSSIPARPISAYRCAHFAAVGHETR